MFFPFKRGPRLADKLPPTKAELAALPEKLEKMFNQNPVENRLKFAADFQAKIEEWKDTMSPAAHGACLVYLESVNQDANAHMLAIMVDYTRVNLDEWEKMKCPPFREIIRREKEMKENLGAIDAIPDYMRAGATKDVQDILTRLEKLQE